MSTKEFLNVFSKNEKNLLRYLIAAGEKIYLHIFQPQSVPMDALLDAPEVALFTNVTNSDTGTIGLPDLAVGISSTPGK